MQVAQEYNLNSDRYVDNFIESTVVEWRKNIYKYFHAAFIAFKKNGNKLTHIQLEKILNFIEWSKLMNLHNDQKTEKIMYDIYNELLKATCEQDYNLIINNMEYLLNANNPHILNSTRAYEDLLNNA